MSTGSKLTVVAVAEWPRPSGYVNGMITEGKLLHVAGQIGWNPSDNSSAGGPGAPPLNSSAGGPPRSIPKDFVAQFDQALANVVAIVRAAGAEPSAIARMTIYVTDLDAYRENLAGVGAAWKKHIGRHYPAMALVGVAGLVEKDARVEIETVAVLETAPSTEKP